MTEVAKYSPELVEDRIRLAALAKRIRTTEFFKDFDKLRTGFITSTQFQRCLNVHFGITLSEAECEEVLRKYDTKKNGLVNYRSFCSNVDSEFNPNKLDGNPSSQPVPKLSETLQYLPGQPTKWGVSQQGLLPLLRRCQEYYRYQGIRIRACYEDFDRHNRGLVTESQFYRSFPGPDDVTSEELTVLAKHYYDSSTGLYNYLRFHADIEALASEADAGKGMDHPQPPSTKKPPASSIDAIFARIQDVVYKNGIRTTEFFKDHDKLRSGVITENQFVCGLSLCCGQLAHLTREEIQKIVDHFRTEDGRVRYKGFCDVMENTYNVPDLERKPTTQVYRPPRGHLSRPLNALGPEEEKRLEEVLSRLKEDVKKKRLLLYPYCRDYDRGKGYTRGVTKPQFGRLLHFISLQVPPEDLKLIERKFENPVGGDINYSAFIQAIDGEYTGQVYEEEKPVGMVPPLDHDDDQCKMVDTSMVDVHLLVARIREFVEVNRIRVSEHFEDFDPLRSGSIGVSRFRQGLTSMRHSDLTEGEFAALCQLYCDPKKKDHVLWKRFLADIDRAYGESGLEQTPTRRLTTRAPHIAKPGDVTWAGGLSGEQDTLLSAVMHRLKGQVQQRRILTKPCFQDFDRHHHGYITRSQFRQCMCYLQLQMSEDEAEVIMTQFSDNKGFNYLRFLQEIQPVEEVQNKYPHLLTQTTAQRQSLQESLQTGSRLRTVNVDQVLERMKTKVAKERIRVLEFLRDYDKLRSYTMSATSFRRALDLCGFNLSPPEAAALEDRYRSLKDPSCVDYKEFSDEMEAIFTVAGLEKMPTVDPHPYAPTLLTDANVLLPEEEQILERTMHRIAERVRVRRIQIMPFFEDYDRVHIGSVTRSQFHRVLSELEIGGLVNGLEFEMIYKKFAIELGRRLDVNYIEFCRMVDRFAQDRWDDPTLK
jgi:Ca2+-binding EF-hand superfamily protein